MSAADETELARAWRQRVCLFAKSPRQGEVKTRLAADIGEPQALAAYQRLVAHAIAQLQAEPGVERQLWLTGPSPDASVHDWCSRWHARTHQQVGADLGERMHHAMYQADSIPKRTQAALVVGADCPGLDAKLLREAFARLRAGAEVVIAPAEDGGYGLIGTRWQTQPIFARSPFSRVLWGSPQVFEQTLARCQSLGMSVSVLPTVWDVDDLADWQRFLREYGAMP